MAGVPAASLFGTQALRIQEILNRNINFLLPNMDPFYRKQFVTSQGVVPADQLGRDLKVIKMFQGSFAGVLEPAGPRGDFVLYGDALNSGLGAGTGADGFDRNNIYLQGQNFGSAAQTFPDPFLGANPRPFRLGVPMRAFVGNMAMSMSEMSADMTPAVIDEVMAPKMLAWANQIAHHICLYTYLNQNDNYKLSTLSSTNGNSFSFINSNTTIRFTVDNYSIDRYYKGLRIQIYNSAGTTARTSGTSTENLIVTRVDEMRNIVEASCGVAIHSNTHPSASAIVAGDIIVLSGSKGSASTPFSGGAYFTGLAGFNSWIKTGDGTNTDNAANCLLGEERDTANSVNVNVNSEFKSFGLNFGGNALTEHALRKILRAWHRAKMKYGQYIDHILAADGIWLAYEATKIGREYLDRTGRLSSIQREGSDNGEMSDGINFEFDGKRYKGYTSNFVPSGEVYGVRLGGNNWKRCIPPGPKGTKKMDQAESWAPAEFVAPALTGSGSPHVPMFRIVNNANLMSEFVQLPIMLRMQLIPDQPAGLKLTSVAEDRQYADA